MRELAPLAGLIAAVGLGATLIVGLGGQTDPAAPPIEPAPVAADPAGEMAPEPGDPAAIPSGDPPLAPDSVVPEPPPLVPVEPAAPVEATPLPDRGPRAAVFRALDKVTGRVNTIEIPVDGAAAFGSLTITVRACAKRPPEEPPEVSAFVEISDRLRQPERRVFAGWMFASSPGLSGLEHPIYDVWVINCKAI